jgi:two-component system, NtrC family, response regulator AtoC
MGRALIVDDDVDFCRMMAVVVSQQGFSTSTVQSLSAARKQIATDPPDVLLLDRQLPDGDGMSLLDDPAVRRNSEVVLMTGMARLESSMQALRYGVADYLVKPVDVQQLASILSRVTQPAVLEAKVAKLRRQWQDTGVFGSLVGRSGGMQLVHELIGRVAQTSIPVLISGESGTGKELVARTIHDLSRRAAGPFVVVSCSGMTDDLVASELFGQEGAGEPLGLLERAQGGTLFLDEICDMPAATQQRLLRVLETGRYASAGSAAVKVLDVRLISASSRDVATEVEAGVIRRNLFYRLNVFPLPLPPLRDRLEDLPLLTAHLLREIGRAEGMFKRVAPEATERLRHYGWPGNIRELRNALHQSCVMTPDLEIKYPWLPLDAKHTSPGAEAQRKVDSIMVRTSAQVEKETVLAALKLYGNHKGRTASALGISIKTLYNRLKEYGL